MRSIPLLLACFALISCSGASAVDSNLALESAPSETTANTFVESDTSSGNADSISVPVLEPESTTGYDGPIPSELRAGQYFPEDELKGHLGPDDPRLIPGWIYIGGTLAGENWEYTLQHFQREGTESTILLLTDFHGPESPRRIIDTRIVFPRKYETQFSAVECDLPIGAALVAFYNANTNSLRTYYPGDHVIEEKIVTGSDANCDPMAGE